MNAAEDIAELEAVHPLALRLAEFACLAVRVEPHFLRVLRQRLVSEAAPGTELELWHSPLAAGGGVDAFAFSPEVQQALRERLAGLPEKELVLALTRACHLHHPRLAQLEVELNALAVLMPDVDDAAIERALAEVLGLQRAGGAAALDVARWLLHAAPRLHPRVLNTGATWAMLLQASAALGGRRLLDRAPPTTLPLATLALLGPLPELPTRPVGVALAGGRLLFRSALLAGAKIDVPAVSPSMVVIGPKGGAGQWVVEAAAGVALEVGDLSALTLRTLTGAQFEIEASRQVRGGGGPLQTRATRLSMRVSLRHGDRLGYEVAERDAQDIVADASTHVRAECALPAVLHGLLASASNDGHNDALIGATGATLHHLLIPREIEYLLGGISETRLVLDEATAAIPWELLDAAHAAELRPWAIRAKLLRVPAFAAPPAPLPALHGDGPDRALVIGAPRRDPALYPPLPGARAEARTVVAQFAAEPEQLAREHVRVLVGDDDAQAVLGALFEHVWRIVHISGHGRADAAGRGEAVMLSDGTGLGAAEFRAMRVVPELVFVSCGYGPGAPGFDRAAFAARFTQGLVDAGVRCVVMAGWAVEDEPALQFAGTFYQALLGGERFVDAVTAAREAAWRHSPRGNTWGAYQCCGDPEWRWSRAAGEELSDLESAEAMASPAALVEQLEQLAVRTASRPAERERLARQVQALELRHGNVWGHFGQVAQAFGLAFGAVDDDRRAAAWYADAIEHDGNWVTFKTIERLARHLIRLAEQCDAKHAADALDHLARAVDQLQRLIPFQRTAEREYLLGVAYKARAMIQAGAQRGPWPEALGRAIDHFGAAQSLCGAPCPAWAFDAARQKLAAELWLAWLDKKRIRSSDKSTLETLEKTRSEFAAAVHVSAMERLEMRWLEALAGGTLQRALPGIVADLRALPHDPRAGRVSPRVLVETRFTLQTYAAVVRGGEAEAAQELIAALVAA